MSPIPGCDRHLDEHVVRSLLREQFPQFAGERIAYLAEGYDHQMYEVGEWLFRFPKRAEVVAWFEREVALMPVIEPVIGVPVPRFEHLGQPSKLFPYPFAGYRRLAGVTADAVDFVDVTAVAQALGPALTRLHQIDPEVIPPAPMDDSEPAVTNFTWDVAVAKLIPEVAHAFLRNEVPRPPMPGPSRVMHNDLLEEHVLIDQSGGGLAGIIDFADLMVADPTGDFVDLIAIGGYELLDATLANYECDRDDHFDERLAWRLRNFHLRELVRALRDGLDPSEAQETVALAFSR